MGKILANQHYAKIIDLLRERLFNDKQIQKIIPILHDEYFKEPRYLSEIIDTWNNVMSRAPCVTATYSYEHCPAVAKPSSTFPVDEIKIDMNYVLGDIEPRLLLLAPKKVSERFKKIQKLGIAQNMNDHWLLLMHAPRGFYLQSWTDILQKFYYIQDNILDFLIDNKRQKEMIQHPLLKSAAVIEVDLNYIRSRFLFAQRTGYASLAHMYEIQRALDAPNLKDLILSDELRYLRKFAPYCSLEDYKAFSDLIQNHDLDEDDLEVVKKMSELDTLR